MLTVCTISRKGCAGADPGGLRWAPLPFGCRCAARPPIPGGSPDIGCGCRAVSLPHFAGNGEFTVVKYWAAAKIATGAVTSS